MLTHSIRKASAIVTVLAIALWAATSALAGDSEKFTRLVNLAQEQLQAQKRTEAESTVLQLRRMAEGALSADPSALAIALIFQGMLEESRARPGDAARLYKQAASMGGKLPSEGQHLVAAARNRLIALYAAQGKYDAAEPYLRDALTAHGRGQDKPADVTQLLNSTAWDLYWNGRYREAESLYKWTIEIQEKTLGSESHDTAITFDAMGWYYMDLGRYAEAEVAAKRAYAMQQKLAKPDERTLSSVLNTYATIKKWQGNYYEAESLYKESVALSEKIYGHDAHEVAQVLNNLGVLYREQGRHNEAEAALKRAWEIDKKALGPDTNDTITKAVNLALVYSLQGRLDEAVRIAEPGLKVFEQLWGPRHSQVAWLSRELATVYIRQGKTAEAERLLRRALEIYEEWRPDSNDVARVLYQLACLYRNQTKYREAEEFLDRTVNIGDRVGMAADSRCRAYWRRAQVSWSLGSRSEAMADLRQAMLLAEQHRSQSAGAEQERATAFAEFSQVFEQMVAWQAELGDAREAFSAIERSRARSLLDDMAQAGADISLGRSMMEREQIQRQETELRQEVAQLEKQLESLFNDRDKAKDETARKREDLTASLAKVRGQLYDHYRDQRNSSPVYRNLLSVGAGPPRLTQVQRRLAGEDGLVLVYLLGEEGGYVEVIGPTKVELVRLSLDAATAKRLGTDEGRLTAKRLAPVLVHAEQSSVLQQLSKPDEAGQAAARLAELWRVLIPEAQRKALLDGTVKRLIVVPDGPLAMLPFETLVVRSGQRPQYLLEAGPPILHAPSTTVLYNLTGLKESPQETGAEPVLTVSNPVYPPTGRTPAAGDVLSQLSARSRYSSLGGALAGLPYSGWESQWIADAFLKNRVKSLRLEGQGATEGAVRTRVAGRRLVHLACHGLADQSYGNFFGALALTPGPDPADAADDGFLTLPEIYELNLKGCELAILSACETNYGPQQRGEGVWALSRGFLVAGARRVIASNWLVDDQATATLMSYFCEQLAQAESAGGRPDYAKALQQAKRSIRQDPKWESPYYWGSLVLVGPN